MVTQKLETKLDGFLHDGYLMCLNENGIDCVYLFREGEKRRNTPYTDDDIILQEDDELKIYDSTEKKILEGIVSITKPNYNTRILVPDTDKEISTRVWYPYFIDMYKATLYRTERPKTERPAIEYEYKGDGGFQGYC